MILNTPVHAHDTHENIIASFSFYGVLDITDSTQHIQLVPFEVVRK